MNHVFGRSRPFDGLRGIARQLKLRARRLWHAYPRETIGAALCGTPASTILERSRSSGVRVILPGDYRCSLD